MSHSTPPTGEADPYGAIDVEVSDTQSYFSPAPGFVEAVTRAALSAQGVTRASISVAVIDDASIREINRRHLGHDWPTDVVSFPLSDPGDPELSGELVVSAEMAVNSAREAGVPAGDELALYLVHGLLHLCGYDDSDDESRARMRRREDEVLTSLGLSNTFEAVSGAGATGLTRGASPWPV